MPIIAPLAVLCLLMSSLLTAADANIRVLHDFEDPAELKRWEFKKNSAGLSDQHATSGKRSVRIAANEYVLSFSLPRDWSGHDTLELDVFAETTAPVAVSLLIGDKPWQDAGGSYWDRHNAAMTLTPGKNTLSIPVKGLYRGEAGSRGNGLKTSIDPTTIVRIDLGFTCAAGGLLFLDQLRLVKETRPDGILAFDLGPADQAVFPGFTPITWTTVHGKDGNKAGLAHAGWNARTARDDTFPTRLYQDSIELGDNGFRVDVANGVWHGWVVYSDCGYWGGETAHHQRRSISAEGKEAWVDDLTPEGPTDYLFRFERIEPKPEDDLWPLYLHGLFNPRRFTTTVTDGRLDLDFKADAPGSSRVAAIILFPDAIKAEAEKWVAGVEARNRAEFAARAVCLGPKRVEFPQPSQRQLDAGWWVGYPTLEQDISLYDHPGADEGRLTRTAARGQAVTLTFAVRPLGSHPHSAELVCSQLRGPAGIIEADRVDLRYVHHGTSRGFASIAYSIAPHTLRPVKGNGLAMSPELTRQFWITVAVPPDAKPGVYHGMVTLVAGGKPLKLPIAIEVLDVSLDEPQFFRGFYGLRVPSELSVERRKTALGELLTLLHDHGMNAFTGGPDIAFTGFDALGRAQLDFAACDEFFRTVKASGHPWHIQSYGGPAMVTGLHDGYVVGETGRGWEKKTGKPFGELLRVVWTAVKEHAEREGWPTIEYGFADEPRTVEQATPQLELMRLYRQHAPWVRIGGSYSVNWTSKEPIDVLTQDIFKTLTWSALNLHTQTDLDQAKTLGRDLSIYNQGTSRYSFGLYQWSELRKGVRGRTQWHTLALHGYQFFDLDGREPDTAMITWGRTGIIPTIALARCREGVDDLRFAVTLWNLAMRQGEGPQAKQALAWLQGVADSLKVGQQDRPKDALSDEQFRQQCITMIQALSIK